MIGVIVAFAAALLASLFGTPVLIKFLVKKQYGQFIRQDGPTAHFTKRGTLRRFCATRISASSGSAAIPGRLMKC